MLHPLLRSLFDGADAELFSDPRQQAVVSYLVAHDEAVNDTVPSKLKNIDEYVKVIILRAEKRYEGWQSEDIRLETAELLRQYKAEYQKRQLEKDIRSAEDRGDEAEIERLRREHYALIKEMKRG